MVAGIRDRLVAMRAEADEFQGRYEPALEVQRGINASVQDAIFQGAQGLFQALSPRPFWEDSFGGTLQATYEGVWNAKWGLEALAEAFQARQRSLMQQAMLEVEDQDATMGGGLEG